tara:strand:- start:468 stop:1043 length:576 start_codon:yes stop_codon:yes gene_type:complete
MSYVLFISEAKLKSSTAINLSVDTAILLPYVLQSQRLYVKTKLGTDLYEKLESLIVAGTVGAAGNEAYATLLNDYIGSMLPNYALYHCIPFLRFRVENGNIYSKTSENGTPITTEESQHLREEVLNTAQYFTERMIDYICNNSTLFPEYSTNTGSDIDPSKEAYFNGLHLGTRKNEGTRITLRNFLNSSDL